MLLWNGVLRASLDFLHEGLGRLEGGNIVLGDDERRILGDIACGLLCTTLEDETAEATEIDILAIGHILLHCGHKGLNRVEHDEFVNTRLLGNGIDDVCFGHLVLFWCS